MLYINLAQYILSSGDVLLVTCASHFDAERNKIDVYLTVFALEGFNFVHHSKEVPVSALYEYVG